MFEFKRQTYKDLNIVAIDKVEFDFFQVKYDGNWARIVTDNGTSKWYSRTGNLKQTVLTGLPKSVLIGEFMFGTQWAQHPDRKGKTFLFDVEEAYSISTENYSYASRRELLLNLLGDHSEIAARAGLSSVNNGEKKLAKEFFKAIMNKKYDYEGIVLRKWSDTIDDPLYRIKRDVMDDFVILDAYEGKGRLAGSLGGLVLGQYTNGEILPVCRVGGGFSDELRRRIWTSWPNWRGVVVTCIGKGRFKSGAIRHPNYLARRDDKLPTECVKPVDL